jgi:nuclear pore complex protein Nup133
LYVDRLDSLTQVVNAFVAFHDGLDFVSVHESLLDDLKSALSNIRARQSIDQQVDAIARVKASKLIASGRRSLAGMFKQMVKKLLQGKALSVEEAADVLSLKDNEEEGELEGYVTALRLLVHAKVRLENL